MKIFNEIPENKNTFLNPCITIGTFDGVHRGHQKVFEGVQNMARRKDGEPLVITFANHPREVLNGKERVRLLTAREEKLNAIYHSGIDNIIELTFTREMSDMPAGEFLRDILVKRLDARGLVLGYDNAFGKDRQGTGDFVRSLSDTYKIDVETVEELFIDGRPVSSTWIRDELARGNMEIVAELLGREYTLRGHIVRGEGRGRDLGFPTANLQVHEENKIIPRDGVYVVRVLLDNFTVKGGICNIGSRPTFGSEQKTVEIHILDFSGQLYDVDIQIDFYHRLRNEFSFPSSEALIRQIRRDQKKAEKLLEEHGIAD